MLIQEEEVGKAAVAEGRAGERRGGGERAKDRSALRPFSPLVVKPGYKAQRDGLGKSCAPLCLPCSPLRPALLFARPPFFLPLLEEWLDCFRCANLTMRCSLAFLPSQVRREPEGVRHGDSRVRLFRAAGCAQISCGRANIPHPWEEER